MICVPGKRLLIILCIPLIVMIGGFFSKGLILAGGLLDIAVLFYSFFDVMAILTVKNIGIRIDPSRIFSIGRKNSIRIYLTNKCRAALDLSVRLQKPGDWEELNSFGFIRLTPGETRECEFQFRPFRRGVYQIQYLYLKYKTGGKLFSIHEKIKIDRKIEVFPDIMELNRFVRLVRKNRLSEIGIHPNRLREGGSELEYLREYHRDDDSRLIEWKATTRINKPVTKVFRMETSNLITLVLDCGRLMTAETSAAGEEAADVSAYNSTAKAVELSAGFVNQAVKAGKLSAGIRDIAGDDGESFTGNVAGKTIATGVDIDISGVGAAANDTVRGLNALDYAINALLILAHIIVRMGDMISIIAFSDRIIDHLPPIKGKDTIKKVSRFITKLKPEYVESDFRLLFSYLRSRIKRRSLIIFFSDLIDDINSTLPAESLHFLNRRHVTLFILLRDTLLMKNAEMRSNTARDLFVSASARQMFLNRKDAIEKLKHSGANVMDLLPSQVTPKLVDKYLEIKSRKRI